MSRQLLYKFLGVAMIQKDLFLAMKRTSWMVIQIIYLIIVGFVLSLNIIYWKSENSGVDAIWSTVGTNEVVNIYLFMQLLAVCIIFPFLAGNSISRERSEKTWALLKTTALTPGELVRGKFFALVSQGIFVLLISAPLLVMTTMLGGVRLDSLLLEYFVHVVLIAWISAVGVLCSALSRKGAASFIGTPLFFFFPMLFVIIGAGESYLQRDTGLMAAVISGYEFNPVGFYVSLSAFIVSGIGSLLGAIHLISPVNSTRSIPTRISIFLFYAAAAWCCLLLNQQYTNSSNYDDFLVYAFLVGGGLIPLLRIAGAGPAVPLGIRQFGRDMPVASRMLVLFTPGGIRNLLFCFLMIAMFIPLGLTEWDSTFANPNMDLVRAEADYNFAWGLFYSTLSWVAAVMALSWFLGQCGCSSILSASMAFTIHLTAVLGLTVVTVRSGLKGWPAYEPSLGMVSTPFNLIQTAGSNMTRSMQRGFPEYFESVTRVDTLFNLGSVALFVVLGCWVSIIKKRPLLKVYSEVEDKLLLDLPDSDVRSLESAEKNAAVDESGQEVKSEEATRMSEEQS